MVDCDLYGDLESTEFFERDNKPFIIQPIKLEKVSQKIYSKDRVNSGTDNSDSPPNSDNFSGHRHTTLNEKFY